MRSSEAIRMRSNKPVSVQILNCLFTVLLTSCPLSLVFFTLLSLVASTHALEIIWAVNAGGHYHIDENGIQYMEDPLRIGTPSDFGKALSIGRVSRNDAILYQTERYHTNSFSYEVNMPKEGDFVLVMKFAEVYFTSSKQKVFNIVLNDQHMVVRDLDIFDKVGLGRAHDEIIPFTIRNGKLVVINEASTFNNVLKITFVKTHYDNPKVNAFYIARSRPEDVPKLPALFADQDIHSQQRRKDPFEEADTDITSEKQKTKFNKRSGPIVEDPYADQEGNFFWPIFCSVVAFIPILICLCKM
ncbi:malectin-A-like [Symsagittifera roscoffensis]|uniref:malectin-A-like n=1 Tax=Symsagittifera roscoffensis TaxID=84072 RepID=UPI00307C46D9